MLPAIEGEQRLQPRMWPEAELARRGLEDRVITHVGVRHGLRAEFEAGFFHPLGVEAVEIQREGNLGQGASVYFRPRRRSR